MSAAGPLAWFRRGSFALVLGQLGAGCGGQAAPAASAPAASEPVSAPAPVTPAPPASAEPTPAESSEAPAPAESTPAAATTAPAEGVEAPRDVKFIKTPEGLRVEILGVKFVPQVETVRTPAGFGVKVTLAATASEPRVLLLPKNGPLALAGSITRAGQAEPERFGDTRDGDGEEPLPAGTTVKLVREWPGKSKVRPLGNGDTLELDVALWGLGTTSADRRAVKQFLHVKAKVEKWKARASVEPPPSMKGKG